MGHDHIRESVMTGLGQCKDGSPSEPLVARVCVCVSIPKSDVPSRSTSDFETGFETGSTGLKGGFNAGCLDDHLGRKLFTSAARVPRQALRASRRPHLAISVLIVFR